MYVPVSVFQTLVCVKEGEFATFVAIVLLTVLSDFLINMSISPCATTDDDDALFRTLYVTVHVEAGIEVTPLNGYTHLPINFLPFVAADAVNVVPFPSAGDS